MRATLKDYMIMQPVVLIRRGTANLGNAGVELNQGDLQRIKQ
jgi:hypothetical protein